MIVCDTCIYFKFGKFYGRRIGTCKHKDKSINGIPIFQEIFLEMNDVDQTYCKSKFYKKRVGNYEK